MIFVFLVLTVKPHVLQVGYDNNNKRTITVILIISLCLLIHMLIILITSSFDFIYCYLLFSTVHCYC